MNSPEIFCFKCKKSYLIGIMNSRIIGPHIETTCPFCKNFIDRNISKFIDKQVDHRLNIDHSKSSNVCIRKAVAMQNFFTATEKSLYDD